MFPFSQLNGWRWFWYSPAVPCGISRACGKLRLYICIGHNGKTMSPVLDVLAAAHVQQFGGNSDDVTSNLTVNASANITKSLVGRLQTSAFPLTVRNPRQCAQRFILHRLFGKWGHRSQPATVLSLLLSGFYMPWLLIWFERTAQKQKLSP
jgi:hypothetical protein